MKKVLFAVFCVLAVLPVSAQFNLSKAVGGAAKAAKALTLSDADMAAYVKESIDWMDAHNPVLPEDNPYTVRLRKLTEGVTDADGIPLNFKVYDVIDINAFACPDGSVRVFSSLMDIMSDEELMGIIGHEIGHVMKRHSKNAFRNELLTGAARDAIRRQAVLLPSSAIHSLALSVRAFSMPSILRSRKRKPTTAAMISSWPKAGTRGVWLWHSKNS